MNRAERRQAERAQKKAAARRDPDALFAEALARHDDGRTADAMTLAEQLLAAEPEHLDGLQLAGMAAIQLGDADKALRFLGHKTRLDPDNAHGHLNHGAALQMKGDLEAAADHFRRAIALDAGLADAHSNLGVTLRDLSRFAEAEDALRRALALSPAPDPRLTVALASVVQSLGRIDEAIVLFDQALLLDPDNADIIYKRCLCHFAKGNFAAAAQDYECRWQSDNFAGAAQTRPEPGWQGEDLKGKRLLVWAEQGVGDHIIYLGSLPALLAGTGDDLGNDLGGTCVFECDQRLVSLFARSLPGTEIVATGQARQSGFDYQIAAASLTLQSRIRFPHQYPLGRYLSPDAERAAEISERLQDAARGRPLIGIAWRSSRHKVGPWKSMPLEQWGPIFKGRDALFVNLQYGETGPEIAAAMGATGAEIYTDPEIDRFDDFEGLAALIDGLDLLVTTSNVTAHFAGALAKPCLLALQVTPLWYWGMAAEPMPLYASMERFWQARENHWTDVAGKIAGHLDGLNLPVKS
jgi:Flp pilus assembly protein TadD